MVGSYDATDRTWLWAWGNPSVPAPLAEHARLAHSCGQAYGLDAYTTPSRSCDESLGWEFAAVACHLGQAQGAYRGATGTTSVFMTFGEVTVSAVGRARPA